MSMEENHDRFLCEIVGLLLDDSESYENEKVWTFDKEGKLIRYYDATKRYESCKVIERDGFKIIKKALVPSSLHGTFELGDIVVVRAYLWNEESPISENTIGVILQRPEFYQTWLEKGKDKYEWENQYVIEFIRAGYLCHMHISEEISNNLLFLHILSADYQGQKIIPEKILDEIYEGKIFLEKVTSCKKILKIT